MTTSKKIEARKDYQLGHLDESVRMMNPMDLFNEWIQHAKDSDPEDYNAMCLSTVSKDGNPSSRIVLLREVEGDCLRFFTNYDSEKGQQLSGNSSVAINFFWKQLERQIRIRGIATPSSEVVSDAYFASRPKHSQIGSWCSQQSQANVSPDIETRWKEFTMKFEGESVIPRPKNWGGYDVKITSIEFWQGRPSRLHDRWRFAPNSEMKTGWKAERLDP